MKILRKSILTVFVVLSVAALIGMAAADPTMTRTLDSTTVEAGGTVHVTLVMVVDESTTALNTMTEEYLQTGQENWNITNVVADSKLDCIVLNYAGNTFNFGRDAFSGPIGVGTYTAEYDLLVDAATAPGTYDIVGYYSDTSHVYATRANATGMTQITVTAPVDVLYDGALTLSSGATDEDALNATGLSYSAPGGFLDTIGSYSGYYPTGGTAEESSGWSIWLNGALTSEGFGNTTLDHGDVLEFIYSNYTGDMWEPDLSTTMAKVSIEASMVESGAVRTIPYSTVYTGLSGAQRIVTVNVDIVIDQDMDGLTLTEILPSGFDETDVDVVENDGAEFKSGTTDGTIEWLWAGTLTSGTEKHIEYTITVDQSEGDYTFGNSFIDAYNVDDILVTGDNEIYVTDDWNPWNDEDSDNGRYITLSELQEALHYWVNEFDAPVTGAEITITRMQALVHFWAQHLEMGDGEE